MQISICHSFQQPSTFWLLNILFSVPLNFCLLIFLNIKRICVSRGIVYSQLKWLHVWSNFHATFLMPHEVVWADVWFSCLHLMFCTVQIQVAKFHSKSSSRWCFDHRCSCKYVQHNLFYVSNFYTTVDKWFVYTSSKDDLHSSHVRTWIVMEVS